MKYIFILGNNPELSKAEIIAVLPKAKVLKSSQDFLVVKSNEFNCQKIINQLGGTIKIGRVIGQELTQELIVNEILKNKKSSKVKFGFSYLSGKKDRQFGMAVKKALRQQGVSSRLVESKDKILSSVVVKKNKTLDFLILPDILGLTCAVQDFEKYSYYDYGRPKADAKSGMLPPKLAKMMINLSDTDKNKTILDPFCGSGTVLSEALAMGFKDLMGSDNSNKAVENTEKNISWLKNKLQLKTYSLQLFNVDIKKLTSKVKLHSVGAVITEPYLGPALRRNENEKQILKIRSELEKLYLGAFYEFKKILVRGGRVVMVWPQWPVEGQVIRLDISQKVKDLGFKRIDKNNLIYRRKGQKVERLITVWEN